MIRHANEKDEIISVIKDSVAIMDYFTLWQRSDDNRVIFNIRATLLAINSTGELIFKYDEGVQIDQNRQVFFAAEKGHVVYKSIKFSAKNNHLTCEIPQDIKYIERRKSLRKRFKKNEHKEIELIFSGSQGSQNIENKVVSKLVDISDGGLCFLMSRDSLQKINLQDVVSLKSLNHDILLASEKAIIVNSRLAKGMTMGHEEMYAVGVMFV